MATKKTQAKPSFQQIPKKEASIPVFNFSKEPTEEVVLDAAPSKLEVDLGNLAHELAILEGTYGEVAQQLTPVLDPNALDQDSDKAADKAIPQESPLQEQIRALTRRVKALRYSLATIKLALVV